MLDVFHGSIDLALSLEGQFLDGWYVCPHHPELGFESEIRELKLECNCRKPNTGMFESIISRQRIVKSNSWIVGDGLRDLHAANNFGVRFAGIESEELKSIDLKYSFKHLLDFAHFLETKEKLTTK